MRKDIIIDRLDDISWLCTECYKTCKVVEAKHRPKRGSA